jgi:hypothetical protein
MQKIKTDVIVIGSGVAAMLAVSQLAQQEIDFVLVNPFDYFNDYDLTPKNGVSLWNAAYRLNPKQNSTSFLSLSNLYDEALKRLTQVFPATVDLVELKKTQCLSVLSSTPIHLQKTLALENEFFKIERKSFSSGQFRLLDSELVLSSLLNFEQINLNNVAKCEGGILRNYGLIWDARKMAFYLNQYINTKFKERVFLGFDKIKKSGKKIELEKNKESVVIEAQKKILIFFTGDLVSILDSFYTQSSEPWIQAVRKKRKERLFAWFEYLNVNEKCDEKWLELGMIHYFIKKRGVYACWSVRKGPDLLEHVVDEVFRFKENTNETFVKLIKTTRTFFLDWEWPSPSWRSTKHETFWATAFEGDLPAILELLWKMPI